jgi:hypothetical protein
MVIDIHRDVHLAVAENSRNDLRMNCLSTKCVRQRMSKVVPPTKRNIDGLYGRPDISIECVPRMHWSRARFRAKHPFAIWAFGSLLLQNGASIVYVKEQMGHSSIQVTVNTYGHLIPSANVCFVDRLDEVSAGLAETTPQQSATPAQQGELEVPPDLLQVVDEIGGGAWTRTTDLRIMLILPSLQFHYRRRPSQSIVIVW